MRLGFDYLTSPFVLIGFSNLRNLFKFINQNVLDFYFNSFTTNSVDILSFSIHLIDFN